MAVYCKAYRIGELRQYNSWSKLAKDREQDLADETIVYVTQDYRVVEDCLSIEEEKHVLLTEPNTDWQDYCQSQLGFQTPTWVLESP